MTNVALYPRALRFAHDPRAILAIGVLTGATASFAQFQGVAGPASISHETFGQFVAALPDVNGDGIDDLAVASGDAAFGLQPQHVFLYSGRTGEFLRSINNTAGVLPWGVASPAPFGVAGLAGLRDVNGDGRGDLAVADREHRRAIIFSGATGARLQSLPPPPSAAHRSFGASVGALDDIDGDGRADLIVGAPAAAPTLDSTGAAYVYSGASGFLLRTIEPPAGGGPLAGRDPMFGSLVVGTTDLDGDGRPDALVAGRHRVTVISGATSAIVRVISGPSDAGGFAQALALCPDADGDGSPDIVIGAPQASASATPPLRGRVAESGRAYLYSGRTGVLLRSFGGPATAGARFGLSVAGVPDLTGDGRGDVIVGAPHNPEAARGTGYGPGRVYVFNGATGSPVAVLNSPNAELGGAFGTGVAGLADTNGNGRADVIIGAPQEDGAAPNPMADRGRAYIRRF